MSDDDLVKRLRQPWDTDRSIMSQTGRWMTERDDAADRIEELEAKLQHQTHLTEQFFALLDKVEETDDGRSFHPNQLRSCRVLDTEKLSKILAELKGAGR